MTRWLYTFLLESDLPWPLQVFWKLLMLTLSALVAYAAYDVGDPVGTPLLYVYAGFFALMALFTKLGEE